MSDKCSVKAMVDCYWAITETEFGAELTHIAIPTLIIHGDADHSAPLDSTAHRTAALLPTEGLFRSTAYAHVDGN